MFQDNDPGSIGPGFKVAGDLAPVPEPASFLFVGTGLLVAAGLLRRLRRT